MSKSTSGVDIVCVAILVAVGSASKICSGVLKNERIQVGGLCWSVSQKLGMSLSGRIS